MNDDAHYEALVRALHARAVARLLHGIGGPADPQRDASGQGYNREPVEAEAWFLMDLHSRIAHTPAGFWSLLVRAGIDSATGLAGKIREERTRGALLALAFVLGEDDPFLDPVDSIADLMDRLTGAPEFEMFGPEELPEDFVREVEEVAGQGPIETA